MYARLPFSAALEVDKFKYKIDEIFNELPHVCGIDDDIIIVSRYTDSRGHNRMLTSDIP